MRRTIAVGVIIFLILISVIVIFSRRGQRPDQQPEVARQSTLVDYADTTTEVRFTLEGKINAREDHRVVQLSVGRDYRTMQVFRGYQGEVIKSQTLGNDEDAYRAFLAALQNTGYTKARTASRNVDALGACPAGQRFHYDILQGPSTLQSLWSTSCGNVRGTFAGNRSMTQNLFEAQFPEYNTFVKGEQF